MIWGDVPVCEGKYMINRTGYVVNLESGKEMKGNVDKCTGYVKVNLFFDGKSNMFLMHRLVAMAFIPNPYNLPQVHHKDGNKLNNSADNLEWVSRKTHSDKMTDDQKKKFRDTYRKNLEKRKILAKGSCL